MTEQELKEYTWELGERLEHLRTVLEIDEFSRAVDAAINEMLDTLHLSPVEVITVFATLMKDYQIGVVPNKLKNFNRFNSYVHSELKVLAKKHDKKNTWINLGRRNILK